MQSIQKFFKSVRVFGEAYSSSAIFIECDYQTDGDTETSAWTAVNGTFDTVPVEEIDLVSDSVASAVTGRRVRFRYRFYTNSNSSTPRMKATVAEMFGKIESKYSYSFSFRAMDFDEDLQGRLSSDRVEVLTNKLEDWASSAQPLTFGNWHSPFDGKTVSLVSVELDPVDADPEAQEEELLGSATVLEV